MTAPPPHVQFSFFKMASIFISQIPLKHLLNVLEWEGIETEHQRKTGEDLFLTIGKKPSLFFFIGKRLIKTHQHQCPLVALLAASEKEIVLKRMQLLLN